MILGSVFLVNLLCAISPCDFKQGPTSARISRSYYKIKSTDGRMQLENEYPIVATKSGSVQGYSMGTIQEKQIFAFEGIRYGEPTWNNNRFRPPIPAKSWRGVYPTHKPGPMCLQIHPLFVLRVIGSEDCLFLNIYTPELPFVSNSHRFRSTPKKLPTIIFIHGGSFIFGEGAEYGPAYLVDQGVILVTINYRLGVLGFMSSGDQVSPGNYGLKDQALAIKWVHDNIERFGGDPEQVTLMGQSAGSISIHLHLLSTLSRPYFRSGISLSGSAFNHFGLQSPEEARKWTNRLAKYAKCPIANSERLVNCLRKQNPAFIVSYQLSIFTWLIFPPVLFAPVIEPKSPGSFISDTPQNLYDLGNVPKYPWIFSMTSQEGYLAVYILRLFQRFTYFRRHFSEKLSVVLNYDQFFKNTSSIDNQVRQFYLGNESPLNVPDDKLANIGTDRFFMNGIVKALRTHSQIAPTYSYLFSYRGKYNTGKSMFGVSEKDWGISHTEDVFYFFNSTRFYDGFTKDDQEYLISQIMTNLIVNFAKRNKPFLTNEYGEKLKIWDSVTPNNVQFMPINNEMNFQMIQNPFADRIKFWESLNLSDTTPFKPISKSIK